jgi:pimeloyl-ACP methyl ester carboxylesterase
MVWIAPMLAHQAFGNGPHTLVFLHGLFARGNDLQGFAQQVVGERDDVRVLLPDLLGHGDSPALPRPANLATVAEAVLAWLDALGVPGRVPIVAHSMGGRVALRMFDLQPKRVGPFAFLDTPPGALQERRSPLSPFIKAMCAAPERGPSEDALMEPFGRVMMGGPLKTWIRGRIIADGDDFTWDFDRHAIADYRWTTMGEDLWSVVERLGAEQLCVFAPRISSYVRPEDRERYAACGVVVQTKDGAKHDMHHEMPPEFLAQIREMVGLAAM